MLRVFRRLKVDFPPFFLEPVNLPFLVAGIVSVVVWAIHTFVGGSKVARPLLEAKLGNTVKYTQYYCWHLVTIVLFMMASAFVYSAFRASDLGWVMTLLGGAFALWGLLLPPFVKQSYLNLPQGWLFVPVTAFGLWGLFV